MPLLVLALSLAACTTLFSNVFGQDDPALFTATPALYRLPLPAGRQHFLLVQGVGGQFSHGVEQSWAFDWAMPTGTPVPAARAGVVAAVRNVRESRSLPFDQRRANYVRIRHADGTVAVYAHIDTTWVAVGREVQAGESIALSGNTGYSTQPHLHFHVELNGRSLPVAFQDVADSLGIPRVGKLYQGTWPRQGRK